MREDGLVAGSVSGWWIEEDFIHRARNHTLTGTKPEVVTYGVSAEEARRFCLPCGGTIQLIMEPLTPTSGMRDLLCKVESREPVARELAIKSGESRLRPRRQASCCDLMGSTSSPSTALALLLAVDRSTGLICDQTIALTGFYSR